jgi:flagellar L-ring protein precursor FlgH
MFVAHCRRSAVVATVAWTLLIGTTAGAKKKQPAPTHESLEQYIARARAASLAARPLAGSLWTPEAVWTNLAADVKAHRVGDLLTVVLTDQFTATADNTVKVQRDLSAQSGVTQFFGQIGPRSGLANLFSPSSQLKLDGQGQSVVQRQLRATLTGQVAAVLPNGVLVVEATRDMNVGNERQTVVVRGLVRPEDISPGNLVPSTALANLEVEVRGRGIVSDATRPPHPVIRWLLRLLNF